MLETTSGSRVFRGGLTFLMALLIAFSASACNGGPTAPTAQEQVSRYSGRWRGNINGLEVVLDVRASFEFLIGLTGTGTARHPTTGEIHPLVIYGNGVYGELGSTEAAFLNVMQRVNDMFGNPFPSGPLTGQFSGNVSRDGRTWPGSWTSTTAADGVPIFGPGVHSVTLVKE